MRFRIRERIRHILDHDPVRWVLCLGASAGLATTLASFGTDAARTAGGKLALVGFLITSPLLGTIAMLVHGQLLYWSGKLLGGTASPRDLHAAQAWASLPLIVVAPLRLPLLLLPHDDGLRGFALFLHDLGRATEGFTETLCDGAGIITALLLVSFIAEAQRFSCARALLNELAGTLLGIFIIGSGLALGYGIYLVIA